MANCVSCGKMKCSCGGMAHREEKRMGGMAMTRPGFPSRGPTSGGMTRPGFAVKPPMTRPVGKTMGMGITDIGSNQIMQRLPMKKGGMAVRRKGTCGKNN